MSFANSAILCNIRWLFLECDQCVVSVWSVCGQRSQQQFYSYLATANPVNPPTLDPSLTLDLPLTLDNSLAPQSQIKTTRSAALCKILVITTQAFVNISRNCIFW